MTPAEFYDLYQTHDTGREWAEQFGTMVEYWDALMRDVTHLDWALWIITRPSVLKYEELNDFVSSLMGMPTKEGETVEDLFLYGCFSNGVISDARCSKEYTDRCVHAGYLFNNGYNLLISKDNPERAALIVSYAVDNAIYASGISSSEANKWLMDRLRRLKPHL